MKNYIVCLLLSLSISCIAQQGSPPAKSLADALAMTPSVTGPAPGNYTTPYLVVQVTPIEGQDCSILLATNGMLYSVFGNRDDGWCNHLPSLHALVWGRFRHSSLGSFLRQSNTADVASDYIDLAYSPGQKPKVAHYIIASAQAIGPEWGQ